MSNSYYSNGKLLITGEYGVLDGALSLAVPTKYGQALTVQENNTNSITWQSIDHQGAIWFEGDFNLKNNKSINTTDSETAETLLRILREAKKLNSEFLINSSGYKVTTQLDFPRNWGLGSSSTLINNIAQWAGVDPFKLLWNSFSGSGYDIACAMHNTPILYQLKGKNPIVTPIAFNPSFKEHIYFVHLNKKQNSREGISAYRNSKFEKDQFISAQTILTNKFSTCDSLEEFQKLIIEHETMVASIINEAPVKQKYFIDYTGAIKSLGAWGGDFIMAVGSKTTPTYFKNKGYATIIPYQEMVF